MRRRALALGVLEYISVLYDQGHVDPLIVEEVEVFRWVAFYRQKVLGNCWAREGRAMPPMNSALSAPAANTLRVAMASAPLV